MSKPWYKQFWPWFLMSLPFSVIIAMIITLIIADSYGDNPMVVDNYYKKGRGINAEVEKIQAAQQLGIELLYTQTNREFTIRFNSGQPDQLTALTVSFYHATQAEKDFSQVLTADAQGVFRGKLPETAEQGKFTITVVPYTRAWRLSQTISLPAKEVILRPLTYGV